MEVNKIYHDDWMNNQLPDKSVQLIIADPPYFEVKGSFDFVWESFDEYLIDVEKWAIECKRLLADNGTLFWYGNSKKIAYSQIIIDKYFNLENSLVWRKKDSIQYQYYSPDLARTFNTHNERLLMYSNEEENKGGSGVYDNIIAYMNEEREKAGLKTCKQINELLEVSTGGGGMAAHYFNGNKIYELPTAEMYERLQKCGHFKKPYDELRKEYDELRRFFYNPNKYEEVLEFSQEGHKTRKYDHDTCKPETLTRALILTCSREKDLVFIPFAGSGTEVAMAIKEGRKAIGFDIEEKYVEMGNKRIDIIKAQPSLFF